MGEKIDYMETKQHGNGSVMKSKRKSENTLRKTTMKTQPYKNSMGCSKSSPKREVHSDTGLSQEIRKISNNNNLPPKRIR